MMTIAEPAGSPTIVYNRDGVTISHITGGTSTASADAVAIVRYSQTTAVVVQTPNTNVSPAISLPSDAEIGDVVEIYGAFDAPPSSVGRVKPTVYCNAGETVNFRYTHTDSFTVMYARFRKVAATEWAVINSNDID